MVLGERALVVNACEVKQKKGLYLCRSNNSNIMGGIEGRGGHTNVGTAAQFMRSHQMMIL